MTYMKKLTLVILSAVALAGCTPAQVQEWRDSLNPDPAPVVEVDEVKAETATLPEQRLTDPSPESNRWVHP